MGRTARRTYGLDDIGIVPSRRTRSSSKVSTAWQMDAYRFDIPLLTAACDAVVSPAVAAEGGRLGGEGVLEDEDLWARHSDPQKIIDGIVALGPDADATDVVA